MGFGIPQILGLSPHSYYHSPRGVLHSDNGLMSSMASCQRFSSSVPNHDGHFQQQSPAIVYSRGGKSLGSSPGTWHTGGIVPDPHRSVLVHTGSPAQSVGPISTGQHPSIIQFSPTNHHLLRDVETLPPPQPEGQQILFCNGYPPQAASHSPVLPQAQAALTQQQPCPTVIQQQPFGQKESQKVRASPVTQPMEAPGDTQRRVTIKEENLDQAYLDDGECKLFFFCTL